MNCREVQENLELFVLDGLSPDECRHIREHLVSCPDCRMEEQALRNTAERFRSSCKDVVGQGESFEKLRRHVYSEIDFVKERKISRYGVTLKVAAMLLGCLGFSLLICFYMQENNDGGKYCLCKPWQYAGVVPCRGGDAAYPLVRGENIFVLAGQDQHQRIVAIRKRTGDLLWRSAMGVTDYLNADDLRIFAWKHVTDGETALVALDQKTGKLLWQYSRKSLQESRRPSHLSLTKNGVCWTEGNRVFLVETQTGRLKWERQIDVKGPLSLPKENGDRIYIASNNALYAINGCDGRVTWRENYGEHKAAFSLPPVLACDKDKIVVGQVRIPGGGTIRCHDGSTGKFVWERKAGIILGLQTDGQHLFVRSNVLLALDPGTVSLEWEINI